MLKNTTRLRAGDGTDLPGGACDGRLLVQPGPQPLFCFLNADAFALSVVFDLVTADFTNGEVFGLWV